MAPGSASRIPTPGPARSMERTVVSPARIGRSAKTSRCTSSAPPSHRPRQLLAGGTRPCPGFELATLQRQPSRKARICDSAKQTQQILQPGQQQGATTRASRAVLGRSKSPIDTTPPSKRRRRAADPCWTQMPTTSAALLVLNNTMPTRATLTHAVQRDPSTTPRAQPKPSPRSNEAQPSPKSSR